MTQPCSIPAPDRLRPMQTGRGFALPVVLVVLLVVSSVSAIVLQRYTAQRMVTEQRLAWYREHHARFGLEEAIDAWLKSLPRSVRLHEVLQDDGHAIDLDLKDGSIVSIFIRDGQGAVLVSSEAVEPRERERVEQIAARFDELVGAAQRPEERRRVGPWSLSLNSASAEAIEAVVDVVSGPGAGARFAQAVIAERSISPGGRLTEQGLTNALVSTGLTEDQAQPIRIAFTLQPSLYFVTIELAPRGLRTSQGVTSRAASRSSEIIRFGGYIPVVPARGTGQGAFSQRSGFLTFERLPIDS